MKKSIALAGLLFLATTLLAQQEKEMSRVDLYGGYSQAKVDPFQVSTRSTLRGWNGSFGLNAASWLSLVVELGGNYGTVKLPVAVPTPFPTCPPFCPSPTDTFNVDTRMGTYLFGVHIPYRKWDRFIPYASVLIGKATVNGKVDSFEESSSGFSMALGGGADIRLTKRWAWRVQADYLHTDFYKQVQDNYRFQTGIVLRFTGGKKKRPYPEIQQDPIPATQPPTTPPSTPQTEPTAPAPPPQEQTTPAAPPQQTAPQAEPPQESTPPAATPPPESTPPPQEPPKK